MIERTPEDIEQTRAFVERMRQYVADGHASELRSTPNDGRPWTHGFFAGKENHELKDEYPEPEILPPYYSAPTDPLHISDELTDFPKGGPQ